MRCAGEDLLESRFQEHKGVGDRLSGWSEGSMDRHGA